jgi:hypothetical protein
MAKTSIKEPIAIHFSTPVYLCFVGSKGKVRTTAKKTVKRSQQGSLLMT